MRPVPKSSVKLYLGAFKATSLSREAAAAINRKAVKVLEQEERREDRGRSTKSEEQRGKERNEM